jgi:hypothetical protein
VAPALLIPDVCVSASLIVIRLRHSTLSVAGRSPGAVPNEGRRDLIVSPSAIRPSWGGRAPVTVGPKSRRQTVEVVR